jgi:hypothetical protein
MRGEPLEDAFCRHPISIPDAFERLCDRGLNRAPSGGIHESATFRQTQHRASSVGGIIETSQEPLPDKAVKHTGKRAGVHVQHGRQIAGR